MTVKLTDEQWQKILPVLKTCPQIRLGAGRDVRRFLEAVLWLTRSGAHWNSVDLLRDKKNPHPASLETKQVR
jgi:transposase